MTYLTVRKIDGRLMLEIPADLAARLRVEDGGVVTVDDGKGDAVVLSRLEADRAEQVRVAERIMRENDWVLSQLAK